MKLILKFKLFQKFFKTLEDDVRKRTRVLSFGEGLPQGFLGTVKEKKL